MPKSNETKKLPPAMKGGDNKGGKKGSKKGRRY